MNDQFSLMQLMFGGMNPNTGMSTMGILPVGLGVAGNLFKAYQSNQAIGMNRQAFRQNMAVQSANFEINKLLTRDQIVLI